MRILSVITGAFALSFCLSSCTPSEDTPVLNALTPPEFQQAQSRVRYSPNSQSPSLVEFIVEFPIQGSAYELVGDIDMEVAFTSNSAEPAYYVDTELSRYRLNNPQTACNLSINGTISVEQERVFYCSFDGYLNNQILAAETVVYRWYATLKLKNGGQDTMDIESYLYKISPEHNPFEQRPAVVNGANGTTNPPIDASAWLGDKIVGE
ncbi:hypothetical protein [Thalassotalea agarivorans]|uniref:Lipoprotein n=1 Tax=Thalassotalea agarivorans TaxID=349064 RepID=A0A1I0CW75_THASX|nr:hypothetical protein [Thalassotalea agarivorans]SET24082.1 hypothetical protein SAMN05660429_01355 [Thalassotalea agarivorans]